MDANKQKKRDTNHREYAYMNSISVAANFGAEEPLTKTELIKRRYEMNKAAREFL